MPIKKIPANRQKIKHIGPSIAAQSSYFCDLCPKKFVKNKTLATHKRKFHSGHSHVLTFKNSAVNIPPEFNEFKKRIERFSLTHKTNLIISCININSLRNKFHYIEFILNEQYVDVLVINETRINNNIDDRFFISPFYHMLRRDRESDDGGGIIVFVKNNLNIESVDSDKNFETISFLINTNNKTKIALIASYRPPKTPEIPFIAHLQQLTSAYEESVEDIIIVGDLNFDMLDRNDNKLFDFNQSNGFRNTIFAGTRLNPSSLKYTSLDVILCMILAYFVASEIINVSFSDHSFILTAFNYKKIYNKSEKRSTRCLTKDKIYLLKDRLKIILPSISTTNTCVNFQWSQLKKVLVACLDSIAKNKQVPSKKSNNSPWIDKSYTSLSKKRDAVYLKAISCKNNDITTSKSLWSEFKILRNKCTNLFYGKKSSYFKHFINTNELSTKKLWKKLSPYISPNKKSTLVASAILKNTSNNNDLDLASAFCNYFSTLLIKFNFLTLTSCLSYITNYISECGFGRDIGLTIRHFTEDEVTKGLKSLVPNSGVGEVGIESIVFVECAEELTKQITYLFNLILTSGIYPDDWKCAHIIPIYKGKGSKTDLENYRPISILSPVSKLFEKLLAAQIYSYLETNKLYNTAQFGFRKNLSCELALNSLMETWKNGLDAGNDVIAVFLDFSKAFDTVDHNLLILKLAYYNFDSNIILLIKNYLTNRSIKVNINGRMSHSSPLHAGVPQGSVLGPLLFILFINDMCYLKIKSNMVLFADDTTISLVGKNPATIIESIETDLIILTEWLKHNKLVLNVAKSQAMCFNSNLKLFKTEQVERLKLKIECDHNQISFLAQVKLLGIVIDNKLDFGAQSKDLSIKINCKSHLLKKSLYLFTENFKPILFKLFIQSHFDYCSTLYIYFSNKNHILHLEKCFTKSIYLIIGVKLAKLTLEDQYVELNDEKKNKKKTNFNILPLKHRILYHLCTFIFNIFKNNNETFVNIFNAQKSKTSTREIFKVPFFKKRFKQFSFTTISIKLLNHFIFLETQKTLSSFKSELSKNIINLFILCEKKNFWT